MPGKGSNVEMRINYLRAKIKATVLALAMPDGMRIEPTAFTFAQCINRGKDSSMTTTLPAPVLSTSASGLSGS